MSKHRLGFQDDKCVGVWCEDYRDKKGHLDQQIFHAGEPKACLGCGKILRLVWDVYLVEVKECPDCEEGRKRAWIPYCPKHDAP